MPHATINLYLARNNILVTSIIQCFVAINKRCFAKQINVSTPDMFIRILFVLVVLIISSVVHSYKCVCLFSPFCGKTRKYPD